MKTYSSDWKVVEHREGENASETLVTLGTVDDSLDFDSIHITMHTQEAQRFPVNVRVILTLEPIQ